MNLFAKPKKQGGKQWPAVLSPRQACEYMEACGHRRVSKPTMIDWCTRYGIGRKIGHRWEIRLADLIEFLDSF